MQKKLSLVKPRIRLNNHGRTGAQMFNLGRARYELDQAWVNNAWNRMERKKRKRREERPIEWLYRVNEIRSSIKQTRIEKEKKEGEKKKKDWLPGR
mgnify:CR=1 FL=1